LSAGILLIVGTAIGQYVGFGGVALGYLSNRGFTLLPRVVGRALVSVVRAVAGGTVPGGTELFAAVVAVVRLAGDPLAAVRAVSVGS
ncbi:hypothetical protein BRD19_02765, partial [Halobacteriales archaeon SW_7_65_23]